MLRYVLAIGFAAAFLTGCATAPQQNNNLELQGLRNQITVFEAQLKDKDQQIVSLQEALDKEAKDTAVLSTQVGALSGQSKPTPSNASIKQTQLALKRAGYDPGPIDGQMGSRTRKAIRHFQQANGLAITGKVDKETWTLLAVYLHEKNKTSSKEEPDSKE